jgi:hypothetical protein
MCPRLCGVCSGRVCETVHGCSLVRMGWLFILSARPHREVSSTGPEPTCSFMAHRGELRLHSAWYRYRLWRNLLLQVTGPNGYFAENRGFEQVQPVEPVGPANLVKIRLYRHCPKDGSTSTRILRVAPQFNGYCTRFVRRKSS